MTTIDKYSAAIPLPDIKLYAGQTVQYAQVKMDGWYAEVYRDAIPRAYFKSRSKNIFDKLPPAVRDAVLRLPVGTILRGELHAPGLAATEVGRLITTADERLALTVFEVPSLATTDFEPPRRLVEAAGLPFVETLRISDRPTAVCGDVWNAAALQRGIEGWVFKRFHSHDGYKHKPVRTCDAVVTAYSLSTSAAYYGGIKSFSVSIDGRRVGAVGAGLDKSIRMAAEPERYVGRVLEIAYKSVSTGGKLEQPRFVRWRDDKPADQCRLDQLAS